MAGTVTEVTTTSNTKNLFKTVVTWLSDGSGDADALDLRLEGLILSLTHDPDSGGTQPTNLYDVTLVDEYGSDLLNGSGANIVNTGPTNFIPFDATGASTRLSIPVLGTCTPTVANAGNAKGGRIVIYWQKM